jgi:DNA-binding IclR family transcriptional regulator
MTVHYTKIAKLLLELNEPISLEKLSLKSNITTTELREIVGFLNRHGFLKFKDDLKKIQLTDKIKK